MLPKINDKQIIEICTLKDNEFCFWAFDLGDDGILYQIGNRNESYRNTYLYKDEVVEYPIVVDNLDYSNVICNLLSGGSKFIAENHPGLFKWYVGALAKQ